MRRTSSPMPCPWTVVDLLEVIDVSHHQLRGRRLARARRDGLQLPIEGPAIGQAGERIGQRIVHRATQLAAQLAELRLEPPRRGP